MNAEPSAAPGFDEKPLLEFSQAEKADVDLKQLFG